MRVGVSALALSAIIGVSTAATAEPLRIGIVESLSGTQTSTGRLYATAAEYVLDEVNDDGGFNGQPVEILEYDNGGDTSTAASRVRQAASDGVHVIIQGSSSAIAGQVTEDIRKHNIRNPDSPILYLNVGAEAMELRGEKCHYHAFHFTTTAPMRVGALTRVMSEQGDLGDRVYSINQNYSWGKDMESAILANADGYNYDVVDTVLHEVNRIQDFSPFVAGIQSADPDAVITGNWSNDLLLMMKAVGDAELDVTFGTAFLDQVGNVANAGDVAQGNYIAHPGNVELMETASAEAYRDVTGHYPVYVEPGAINGLNLFRSALDSVDFGGGDIDTNAIAAALETASLETELGELTIRESDHQTVMPVVVSQVSQNVDFPVDDTQYGFKPIEVVSADEVIHASQDSCQMRRP
jgi:branched-chain amino acid transport system substrate-binding protein